MTHLYGRAKNGVRAVDSAPGGHWNTTTMIPALTLDGYQVAMVVNGTTNREVFKVYVEMFLLPTLEPGDYVILDNTSAHKGNEIRKMIESVGAELWFLPPYSPGLTADGLRGVGTAVDTA